MADTNGASDGELLPSLRSTRHEAGDKEMEVCQLGLSYMYGSERDQCSVATANHWSQITLTAVIQSQKVRCRMLHSSQKHVGILPANVDHQRS